MATHIFTSVAANYLAKARVLAGSVKKFHPEFQFHLLLCDAVPAGFSLESEPFDSLIAVGDFGLENPEQWIFQHTLVELTTAAKGFALEKLLDLPDCSEVLFFDPDIVVLAPLDRLLAEFANASILLTPHLTEPEVAREAILDNELSVLRHGVYNLGFLGVKNSAEGRRFAGWWRERLKNFCFNDIARGLFTDQRWADLTPAYFPDHKILRDAAYNVCTWNLTHRAVTGAGPFELLVNGGPVVFYHFSGFDSGAQLGMLEKYGSQMPGLYQLRDWYVAECERHGQSEVADLRWAYGFFDNGVPILKAHRKVYRERPDLQSAFPNPYATGEPSRSYLYWFDRNEGNWVAARPQAVIEDSLVLPEYRVFLIALAGDAAYLEETLKFVRERTSRGPEIYLAGSAALLQNVTSFDGIGLLPNEASTYDELFAALVDRCGDRDALLIRAGVIPPEKWDVRLAWSAVRQQGVATVSAVDQRMLDPSGRLRSTGPEDLLDRLCYSHRQPTDLEIAAFSRDCVYVRTRALREFCDSGKVTPTALLNGAARLRYTHVLATHLCVASRRPRESESALQAPASLASLLDRVRAYDSSSDGHLPSAVKSMTGATLHVVHSWGGGVEQWVAEYCRADRDHENFILKSVGDRGASGTALALYRRVEDTEPLEVWPLEPAIKATATGHSGYRCVLDQISSRYGIRRIVVSSLIGHSLDALQQPAATMVVCHDYYPFCSAFNITFDGVCESCDESRLVSCIQTNPHNRFFPNVPPVEWMNIRTEFARAILAKGVSMIAPSPSVRDHYARLFPDIASSLRVIPHGREALLPATRDGAQFEHDGALRVLILGSLAPHKGGLLLECLVPELLRFAHLALVGCGDYGRPYLENPKITVIPQYEHETLPTLISDLKPDIGLLLSVVPETFSYTLGELQDLGVPVLASALGSFADRIEDGVSGLLCAPEPSAIVRRLEEVAKDRDILRRIHENLKSLSARGLETMLRDYDELDAACYFPGKYFAPSESAQPLPERRLQLFWRSGSANFEERNSTSAAPFGHERQTARLYFLSGAETLRQLRLDLSEQTGFFLLHDLSVRDAGDRVIWRWNHDLSDLESAPHKDIFFFASGEANASVLLYFTGSDPYIVLPIDPDLFASVGRGACVEVDFSLPSKEESLTLLLASEQHRSQRVALLEAELQAGELRAGQLQAELDTREKEMQDRETRVRELEETLALVQRSLSWRVTRPARMLAGLRRRITALLPRQ